MERRDRDRVTGELAHAREHPRGEQGITAEREEIVANADRPRVERAAARPSFNCRYARSRVEKMVCGSEDLAARDRRMAGVFTRASERSDAETRRRLSASRLRFLAYRDRCGNADCVAEAYSDRIDEINDIAGR